MKPLISVITVVYNGESCLEKTIKSLLDQSFKDWEYIVIDGGSSDRTIQIIKKYNDNITKWISEPDNGIYDAMNKSLKIANGKYINFLNAGDSYTSKKSLEKTAIELTKSDPPALLGGWTIYSEDGQKMREMNCLRVSKAKLNMFNTRCLCHQTIFVKTGMAVPYSTKYTIKGDLNWYYDLLKKIDTKEIKYIDESICDYYLGGISNRNIKLNYKEQIQVMRKHNSLFVFLLYTPFLLIPLIFKLKLKIKLAFMRKKGLQQ